MSAHAQTGLNLIKLIKICVINLHNMEFVKFGQVESEGKRVWKGSRFFCTIKSSFFSSSKSAKFVEMRKLANSGLTQCDEFGHDSA